MESQRGHVYLYKVMKLQMAELEQCNCAVDSYVSGLEEIASLGLQGVFEYGCRHQ